MAVRLNAIHSILLQDSSDGGVLHNDIQFSESRNVGDGRAINADFNQCDTTAQWIHRSDAAIVIHYHIIKLRQSVEGVKICQGVSRAINT